MAKATEKNYVVSDQGYLFKAGKVIKTGETVKLTSDEYENVKHLVVADNSKDGKQLAAQTEAEEKAKADAEAKAQADADAKAKAEAEADTK